LTGPLQPGQIAWRPVRRPAGTCPAGANAPFALTPAPAPPAPPPRTSGGSWSSGLARGGKRAMAALAAKAWRVRSTRPSASWISHRVQAGERAGLPAPDQRRLGPWALRVRTPPRTPLIHFAPPWAAWQLRHPGAGAGAGSKQPPEPSRQELPRKPISRPVSAAVHIGRRRGTPRTLLENWEHYPASGPYGEIEAPRRWPSRHDHGRSFSRPWWKTPRCGGRLRGRRVVLVAGGRDVVGHGPAPVCQVLVEAPGKCHEAPCSGSGMESGQQRPLGIEAQTRPRLSTDFRTGAGRKQLGPELRARSRPPCSQEFQHRSAPAAANRCGEEAWLPSTTPEAHRLAPPAGRARANSGRPPTPDRARPGALQARQQSPRRPLEVLQGGPEASCNAVIGRPPPDCPETIKKGLVPPRVGRMRRPRPTRPQGTTCQKGPPLEFANSGPRSNRCRRPRNAHRAAGPKQRCSSGCATR